MGERKGPPLKNGRKTAVAIVALMIAAMFVASAVPMVFGGDDVDTILGADTDVPITQTMTVAEIGSAIQSALDAAATDDTVTVTGTKTDADGPMTLDIPSDVTLVWAAVYTGKAVDAGKTNMCIELTGAGTFEVADGAEIEGNELKLIYVGEGESLNIVVSGGSIVNTNNTVTFCIHSEGLGSFVMTGGSIRSSGSMNTGLGCAAVWFEYGEMTVSGGTISTESALRFAIAVYTTDGDLTVSGGTISSKGERGRTIHALNGLVTMTGGKVTTDGLESVGIIARGGLVMSGGEITANGGGSFAVRSPYTDVIITNGTLSASGEDAVTIYMGDNDPNVVPVLAITGGTVKVSGENSRAVSSNFNGAVIVYLKGTVSGETGLRTPSAGVIAEVSTLNIPGSYNGTSNGVTIVRGTLFGLEDFVWMTGGETTVLNIGETRSVIWTGDGTTPGETDDETDGGDDNGSDTILIVAVAAAAVAAVGAGAFFLLRRS